MSIHAHLSSHRGRRLRFLALLALTLVGVFYYSFLNEAYELNQHLDEEELPHVTGQDELTKEQTDALELSAWESVVKKNRYFPLLNDGGSGTKVDFRLPPEYFDHQKTYKVRAWKKKELYPVGKENYKRLPKIRRAADYPQVQAADFQDGGKRDEEKLGAIREAFKSSWAIYKEHAYGHDEVTPLSHKALDSFNGWSATLVDALDTMHMMGLEEDFNDAVKFIKKKVNFKQSFRDSIPVFENTIRILGGLLSAYDLTNDKDVLNAAKDIGGLLMEAFDTPNRMPLLYYDWTSEAQNRLAGKRVHLSEIGTLSLEFARLSQLTGDNKYYDAIDRITQKFYESRSNSIIKGLFSNYVDVSGCRVLSGKEVQEGAHLNNKKVKKVITHDSYSYCEMIDSIKPSTAQEDYSLGGLGDSFYEYLPKMYHFLRGHTGESTRYSEMYASALNAIKQFMLFTPKLPGGENTLFVSSLSAYDTKDAIEANPRDDMQHLTCFVGGMIGLGAKLFNMPEDMETAKKVTLGCVNMYALMGIMPEQIEATRADPGEKYDEQERLAQLQGTTKTSNKPAGVNRPAPGSLNPDEDSAPALEQVPPKPDLNPDSEDPSDLILDEQTEPQVEAPVDGLSKRQIKHVTVVNKGKPINYNIHKRTRFAPVNTLADGSHVWNTGSSFNQPLFLDDMHPTYILRPEAIESVWYMYRLTGDPQWRDYGWSMWKNIERLSKKDGVFTAVLDVTKPLNDPSRYDDAMESFWFSETLKYFYLLFEDASVFSLDEWVFNTEAHPFKLVN